MIQADRLAAVRRSLRRAIPVNGILGLAVLTVAYRGGLPGLGLAWFAASLSVNVARYTLCRMPVLPVDANEPGSVAWHLMMHRFAAFSSGIVWALVAILTLFGWMLVARLVRGEVLKLKNLEYVDAARALGQVHSVEPVAGGESDVILDHHGLEPVAEREVADARGHLGQRRVLVAHAGRERRIERVAAGKPALNANRAAMTVTRTSSPRASSMTAPKMMLASGWATS